MSSIKYLMNISHLINACLKMFYISWFWNGFKHLKITDAVVHMWKLFFQEEDLGDINPPNCIFHCPLLIIFVTCRHSVRNNGSIHFSLSVLACSCDSWHCPVIRRQRAPGLHHESEWEARILVKTEHTRCHVGAFWCEQSGSKIQNKKRAWHFNPYPRKQQLHYCEGKIKANGDFIWLDRLLCHGLNHFSHNFCPFLLQPIRVPSNAGQHSNIICLNYFPGTGQRNKDLNGLVSNTSVLV